MDAIELPICHIDSDALTEPGRGMDLAIQIDAEIEATTPDEGFFKASADQQNLAMTWTHREVAYRDGSRFLPMIDICARNPLFPGAKVPPMSAAAGDGVCLITGGTGGLGLCTAEAALEQGVKTIVLSSRSGKITRGNQGLDETLDRIMKLAESKGSKVLVEACDGSDENQVISLLTRIRTKLGKLKWVFNAAGVVYPQDPQFMQATYLPKCYANWYMHKHTLQDDLKAFVAYSSMSAGAGANELGNYASANIYVEELCRLRQSMGLAGVAIEFPEVEGAGMAADLVAEGGIANCKLGHAKQAFKQILCGKGPMAPAVPLLPTGYLIPRQPTADIYLDPLRERLDKDLFDQLESVEKQYGKQGSPLRAKMYPQL